MDPDPGALERRQKRQVRTLRNRKYGAFALAAIGVAALVLVAMDRPTDGTTTLATAPFDRFDGHPGIEVSAGTKAKTRVTISKSSGFHGAFLGTVESTRPFKCAADRKVVVFKRQGPVQDPRTDKKVASDTAYAVGPNYRWQAQVTNWMDQNGGWFYARVGKTESCRADSSRTRRLFIAG